MYEFFKCRWLPGAFIRRMQTSVLFTEYQKQRLPMFDYWINQYVHLPTSTKEFHEQTNWLTVTVNN